MCKIFPTYIVVKFRYNYTTKITYTRKMQEVNNGKARSYRRRA
jgi:hypothetical protein